MATSESTPLLVPLGGESSASPQDPPPSPKQSISTSTQDGNNVGSVNVVPVLMELIGGRDLPIAINADVMDTYCVVQFGTQTIHRTMPFAPKVSSVERVSRAFRLSDDGNSGCSPTNGDGGGTTGRQKRRTRLERDVENPIWTVHHDSMFVCAINTPRDVDNHKAVVVSVWTRPRPKTLQDRALRAVASPIVQGRRAVAPPSPRIGGGGGPDATRGGATQQQRQPRFVGKIRIPAPDVLHRYCRSVGGRDDRVELPLVDDIGRAVTNEDGVPATLSFRCRVASDADISFVRNVALVRKNLCGDSNSLMRLAHSDGTEVTSLRVLFEQADVITEPNRPRASLITEVPEFEIQGSSFSAALSGSVIPTLLEPGKVKVKPYPDPHRVSKNGSNVIAHYMSPREVKAQTGLPSRSWVQAGTLSTSSFGRVYIEVLSCHDLPNVDIGEAVGNQTDAFVSIIYADAMVETDVIDDELSPHFPPWSQRAFCFPIHHPNQVIYLAVFGFKRSPLQHRRIGRVEINPIHFQHNTVYDLRYALAASSHSAARTSNGVVRVRIRMEVDNERGYLLASLKPPPPVYINVKRKKSLIVARFTARGEYDNDERFQLSVLQGYIDEIVEGYVRRLLYSVQDGLRSLVLWRNQVFLFNGRIGFPIYSLLIFVLSLLAVISPRLIPGILCLEFALLMLVQMQHRINDPSPLRRCFRFGYYFRVLIGGKTVPPAFDKLEENSGLEELQALQKAQEARAERDREFFDKKDEVEKLIEELEHEFIETKSKVMIPLEIMAVLGKLQGAVGSTYEGVHNLFLNPVVLAYLSAHQFPLLGRCLSSVSIHRYNPDLGRKQSFLFLDSGITSWRKSPSPITLGIYLEVGGSFVHCRLPGASKQNLGFAVFSTPANRRPTTDEAIQPEIVRGSNVSRGKSKGEILSTPIVRQVLNRGSDHHVDAPQRLPLAELLRSLLWVIVRSSWSDRRGKTSFGPRAEIVRFHDTSSRGCLEAQCGIVIAYKSGI